MKRIFLAFAITSGFLIGNVEGQQISASHVASRKKDLKFGQDLGWAQQGRDYFEAKNFNGAWYCFNEAIKINPDEQYYFYMRAAVSANQGNSQAAIVDYQKALKVAKKDEDKGWIHYDMAITYAQIGDENNSEKHLIAAAKLGHGIAQNFCNQYQIKFS